METTAFLASFEYKRLLREARPVRISVVHYAFCSLRIKTHFLPHGLLTRWVTVGEVLALGVYLLLILSMIYQGVGFKMAAYYGDTEICAGDPSARCNEGTEERATASGVTMCVYCRWFLQRSGGLSCVEL